MKDEKDIDLFGSKQHVDVRFKNKSIYFASSILPLKMLVYGGEYPLYLEFKEAEAGVNQKVFTLVDTFGISKKEAKHTLAEIDKKIINIVKTISPNGDFTEKNYYQEDLNVTTNVDGLEVFHMARYKDPQLIIDKYLAYNPTFKTHKLREVPMFTKEQKALANAFGNFNGVLEYDASTWVYVFREVTPEMESEL
ncbi:MAG: hypothetical protein PHE67_08345 [Campylobacterales bacterium]|nr:hypothetical protein [Campylobacterales bacterium]